MPIVQISIMPQSVEKKAELSKAITSEMTRITGIPGDVITILFNELPAENIATGGEMLTEKMKRN